MRVESRRPYREQQKKQSKCATRYESDPYAKEVRERVDQQRPYHVTKLLEGLDSAHARDKTSGRPAKQFGKVGYGNQQVDRKCPTPVTCALAGKLIATICGPKEVTKPISARLIKYPYRSGKCTPFPYKFKFMDISLINGSCGTGRFQLRRQIDTVRRLNTAVAVAMK